MKCLVKYLAARFAEPTTKASLGAGLAAVATAIANGADWGTIILIALTSLAGALCPEGAQAALREFGRQEDRAGGRPAMSFLLFSCLLMGGSLSACVTDGAISTTSNSATASVSVAPTSSIVGKAAIGCKIDSYAQPIFVNLVALIPNFGATIATIDQAIVHPAVVAICNKMNGAPIKVAVTASTTPP